MTELPVRRVREIDGMLLKSFSKIEWSPLFKWLRHEVIKVNFMLNLVKELRLMPWSLVLWMKVPEAVSSLARLVTIQEREPIHFQRTCQTHMTTEKKKIYRVSTPREDC